MNIFKTIIAASLVAAAVAACYSNTLRHPFVYDDLVFIAGNKHLADPSNIEKLFTKEYFEMSGERSYRPVSTAVFFIEHAAGDGDPGAFRKGSIAAMAAAAALAFFFMLAATGRLDIAFFTALIYGCHPIQTEAVNGSSFIEDPISAALLFGSMLIYVLFRRKDSIIGAAALAAASLAAMLAKESAAVIPLLVVLYEATLGALAPPGGVKPRRMIFSAFAALACFLAIRFVVFANPSPGAAASLPGGTPSSAFAIVSMSFLKYLQLFFMPYGFSVEGCVELTRRFVEAKIVMSLALHGGLLAAAVALRKHNRLFSFSAFFYLVCLLPVSNIIPFGAAMAERYMCVPSFGLAALFVCCFLKQDGDEAPAESARPRYAAIGFAVFLVCAVLFLASKTVERNKVWSSGLALWEDAVKSCPDSSRARNNFGRGLMEARRYDEAVDQYREAVSLDPANYEAWNSLGSACIVTRDFKCANDALRAAYRINPSDDVKYNFILYYLAAQRPMTAISIIRSMLEKNPGWAEGKYLLGSALLKKGDYKAAEPLLRETIKNSPGHVSALGNLGLLLMRTGRAGEAKKMFHETLKLDHGNETAIRLLQELDKSKSDASAGSVESGGY